jgi:hypothetical protein
MSLKSMTCSINGGDGCPLIQIASIVRATITGELNGPKRK